MNKYKIKQYLPIRWLKDGKIPLLPLGNNIADDYAGVSKLNEILSYMKANYDMTKVKYLTKPFEQAIYDSQDVLSRDEIWNTEFSDSGVLVTDNLIYIYYIDGKKDGRHDYSLMCFTKDGSFLIGGQQILEEDRAAFFLNPSFRRIINTDVRDEEIAMSVYKRLVTSLLFIKYAKVETKEVEPGKKVHFQDCRYFNDSDTDVQLYDCTWFTTLVKSGEFKVRGHFRLQPYKDKKELIWIKEFKKAGYTREARKETINK